MIAQKPVITLCMCTYFSLKNLIVKKLITEYSYWSLFFKINYSTANSLIGTIASSAELLFRISFLPMSAPELE